MRKERARGALMGACALVGQEWISLVGVGQEPTPANNIALQGMAGVLRGRAVCSG
jgi:hypothetical protein